MKLRDEVDFSELIIRFFLFIYRYILLIAICTILGAGLGYLLHLNLQPYYTSRAVINSEVISGKSLVEVVNSLQGVVEDKNYVELAGLLDVDEEIAISFRSIEVVEVTPEEKKFLDVEAERLERNVLAIEIQIYSPDIIPRISKGITNYIGKNSFIEKSSRIRIHGKQEMIDKIEEEIRELDSVQKRLYSSGNLKEGSQFIDVSINSTQQDIVFLMSKKYQLGIEKEFSAPFNYISPFTRTQKPSVGAAIPILSLSFVFFVIGILIGLGMEINRKVKAHLANRN